MWVVVCCREVRDLKLVVQDQAVVDGVYGRSSVSGPCLASTHV